MKRCAFTASRETYQALISTDHFAGMKGVGFGQG